MYDEKLEPQDRCVSDNANKIRFEYIFCFNFGINYLHVHRNSCQLKKTFKKKKKRLIIRVTSEYV